MRGLAEWMTIKDQFLERFQILGAMRRVGFGSVRSRRRAGGGGFARAL